MIPPFPPPSEKKRLGGGVKYAKHIYLNVSSQQMCPLCCCCCFPNFVWDGYNPSPFSFFPTRYMDQTQSSSINVYTLYTKPSQWMSTNHKSRVGPDSSSFLPVTIAPHTLARQWDTWDGGLDGSHGIVRDDVHWVCCAGSVWLCVFVFSCTNTNPPLIHFLSF